MNRIEEQPKEFNLCGQVIGAAMKVHSALGPRFLESVYQNALMWELRNAGLKAEAQRPITVRYDRQIVGAFTADSPVNDSLIVELKATQSLAKAHEDHVVNYLVATGIDAGAASELWSRTLRVEEKVSASETRAGMLVICQFILFILFILSKNEP